MYRVTLETENETYEYDIDEANEQKAITNAFNQLRIELGHKPRPISVDVVEIKESKEFLLEIPIAGVYEARVMLPTYMTDSDAIEFVINSYNESSAATKAYKRMITGQGIEYPLNFAKTKEA